MQPFRLALEWFLNPDHVPLLVGQELGWFEEVGLDLELIEPRAHFDAAEMLAAGEIDAAITEPIHLVEDRAKGRAVTGFMRFLHTNGGVMYLKGQGIERPRDLQGKRLQYPGAPGPGGPAIVASMIQADGGPYDPASLVPVNNGFHHTNALLEGKADAATLTFVNFENVEARHRGLDPAFFALKDWGVPDFCQLILVAPEGALSARPEPYRALVRVMRRAIDLTKQEPERARAIYNHRTKAAPNDTMGEAIYQATTPCFTHDFSMAEAYYDRLGAWMKDTNQIEESPAVQSLWTNDLALD